MMNVFIVSHCDTHLISFFFCSYAFYLDSCMCVCMYVCMFVHTLDPVLSDDILSIIFPLVSLLQWFIPLVL